MSIDKKKPSSFDIYLPPLEILHKDFQVLRKSVESAAGEHTHCCGRGESGSSLSDGMTQISVEN